MRPVEHLHTRARRLLRGLLPVVVAAGAAVTCDSPMAPARREVALAIQPVMRVALGAFGGLTVDRAQVIVVQLTASETFDTLANRTLTFSPDSAQITASVSVNATDTTNLLVFVQLFAGNTLMFSGETFVAADARGQPTEVPLSFVGPGTQIASIQIAPRDTSIPFSSTLQFRLTAADSSESLDTAFYAAWSTSSTANTVNADGLFRAGRTAGTVWVYAHTPTGISDSTRVTVSAQQAGVPAAIVKVAGDGQTGLPGTAVAVAPSVKVTDGFGTAVSGVAVTFAVTSGGGSVTGGGTTTNASGVATVGSWTLGATAGTNTLTATVAGLPAVTFTAIAVSAGPAILLSVAGNFVGVSSQGLLLVKLTQPAPSGGVTVTLTSDSTRYVTVASPGTIAFAAGDTLKSIVLTGVAVGVSVLHATAPGYTAGLGAVIVTSNLIVLQAPFALPTGQSTSLSIQLVPAAPAGGVTVTLRSTDTTILKITTPTVTIAAGQTTGSATVQGRSPGVAVVTASSTVYAPAATVVTVAAAGVPASIVQVAGDGQTGQPGVPVAVAPAVEVRDGLGTAVSGVTVTFAVASGGGSVTGATTTTNASGVATVGSWTLGATPGANTLTATVAGLPAVTFTAFGGTAGPVILLDVPGNLIAVGGQTLALVRLSQPAPTGGVTVTVTSDSTQYVTVAPPGTVALAAGDTLQSIVLTGVALGVSILHATAAGYTAGITGVVVTTNQILLQAPFSMLAGQSTSLSIQLVPAAPAGGATVTLESTDATILSITTPSVTIAAGQATGSATVQALSPGVAVVTAFSTVYAPGATAVTVTLGVSGLPVVMPARAATPSPAAPTVVSVPAATQAAAPSAAPPAPPRRP